jgi:hypothetical protein
MILSNPWMKMFIQSDKQKFQVRALVTTMGDANIICNLDPTVGVICEDEKTGIIVIADLKPTEA